jgi:hypothetical protein
MLCRLFRHKHERKTTSGAIESSELLVEAMPGMHIKIKWCFRCEKYIVPPLNIKMTLDLFGNVK